MHTETKSPRHIVLSNQGCTIPEVLSPTNHSICILHWYAVNVVIKHVVGHDRVTIAECNGPRLTLPFHIPITEVTIVLFLEWYGRGYTLI